MCCSHKKPLPVTLQPVLVVQCSSFRTLGAAVVQMLRSSAVPAHTACTNRLQQSPPSCHLALRVPRARCSQQPAAISATA